MLESPVDQTAEMLGPNFEGARIGLVVPGYVQADSIEELKDYADEFDREIVVTGWNPHWKFSEMVLKYLEDPAGAYGEAETINSIGRAGIEEDLPKVADIMREFKLDDELLGSVMAMINEEMDPEDASEEFVDNNS